MNDQVKSVINDVFQITGEKINEDDPLITEFLMNRHFFETEISKLKLNDAAEREEFLSAFSKMVQELSAKVDQVEQLRKQLLLELLQKNQDIQAESAEKIYGRVGHKLDQLLSKRPIQNSINWSFIICMVQLVILIYIVLR
ncbi:hypothetical protein PT286_04520 [Neisseriaceae bacterium ESL0693]|nr:hypothetical protein [Neisseriaceae bacterium ESL0693]